MQTPQDREKIKKISARLKAGKQDVKENEGQKNSDKGLTE
jgi:hypothetical protein